MYWFWTRDCSCCGEDVILNLKSQATTNLPRAEHAVRFITSANNKGQAVNELFGKSGSKKRKSIPASLRRKVFGAIHPERVAKAGMPLTAETIRLRESLRSVVASNDFYPLENEAVAYEFMEKRVSDLQGGRIADIKAARKEIAGVFQHYEMDPALAFTKKYEELSYFNGMDEADRKVIYGQFLVFSNEDFKMDVFIPSKTSPVELTSLLSVLNSEEIRIFLETVILNPECDEDDIGPFIHTLVAVAEGTDEDFGKDVRTAITEVGKTLVLQVLHLANDETLLGLDFDNIDFVSGDIGLSEDRTRELEKKEEEKLDRRWYYERQSQEILLISIDAGLLAPSQTQFELLYDAALTEEVRNRIMVGMVKATNDDNRVQDVEDFIFGEIENATGDSDAVKLRKVSLMSNLSMLGTHKALDFLEESLTGNDVYMQAGAYECIACNYTNGIEVIEPKVREEILAGNYKLFGIVLMGASGNERSPFVEPAQEVIRRLFQRSDINMEKTLSTMDGLSLPFDDAGSILVDEVPKTTYDFLSALGLKFLASLIVKNAPEAQRSNATKVIKMFPSSDKKVFMTKPEGRELLRRLF